MSSLPQDVRARIAALAGAESVVLASDFDGCLSPIVEDPMAARPGPGAMEALRAAADLPGVTVALVSGRDMATLRSLTGVGEDEPLVVIGTHGAQTSRPLPGLGEGAGAQLSPAQQDARAHLETAMTALIDGFEGAHVELKPAAVAVHTRRMADQAAGEELLARAREVAAGIDGVHPINGKCVLEASVVKASKGAALTALAQATAAQATIYLGDDVTDETAFAVLDPQRGDLSIKVGPGDTAAVARVDGPPQVVEVIEEFVAARRSALGGAAQGSGPLSGR